MVYELKRITKSFQEWLHEGICPDCGGDLDYNNECPGWYDERPNPKSNLSRLLEKSKDSENTN